MKKIFFSLCILSFSQFGFSQKDQVVMDINGEKVTKSEFLQIYLKNNNDPKYDKTSLDDYIELFKKFKLKSKKEYICKNGLGFRAYTLKS